MQEYTEKSLKDFLKNNKVLNSAFISELLLFEQHIDKSERDSLFNIYLNLCKAFCMNREFETAIEYANRAEKLIPSWNYNFKKDLFFEKGHTYSRMDSNAQNAEEAFIKHIYYNSCPENFVFIAGIKLRKPNEFSQKPLYSFRPINKYSISDLIKEELTLADPVTFNDPFDTPLFCHLDLHRAIIKKNSDYDIKPMVDAYKHLKVRCFVKHKERSRKQPFENQLMWSHYADSHKGICIRYKFDEEITMEDEKEKIFSIWYNVDYKTEIKPDDPKSFELRFLLATKEKCWEYENEVRLVHFDPACPDKYKPLSIKGSKIEAIFFGYRCTDEDKQTIRKIFHGKTDVEFFEFKFDLESYGLKTYKLNLNDKKRFKKLE